MLFSPKSVFPSPDVLVGSTYLRHTSTSFKYMAEQLTEGGAIKDLYRDMAFKFDASPDFCPNLNVEYFNRLFFSVKQCFVIAYKNTTYRTYAILLSQHKNLDSKNHKLVIYNHGHMGLPKSDEKSANLFRDELVKKKT